MKTFRQVCTNPELVEYNNQLEDEGKKLIGDDVVSRAELVLTALMMRVRKLEEQDEN